MILSMALANAFDLLSVWAVSAAFYWSLGFYREFVEHLPKN